MKKSKARARNQAPVTGGTAPSSKPKPKTAGKDARPMSRKSEPELVTKELITRGSMDLDPHLLQMRSARLIAKSLKHSADESDRLDSTPFHSAMSVLGALISHVELLRARLEAAKKELRVMYGEADEKTAGEHEAVPPREFARKRGATKGRGAPATGDKPSDNRPRSRPNKVV